MGMRGLLIPILFFVILILAVVVGAQASSDQDPLPLTTKHKTQLVVASDGTVYLVESFSGKILWSFSSGPSIYSTYQQIPSPKGEMLDASVDGNYFYIDCGEHRELYLHRNGQRKEKLPLSADELIKRTPFELAGGGFMLGSKKTSIFLVDPKTGKIIGTFGSDNLSPVGEDGAEEASITTDTEKWLPASSVDTEAVEKPLYVSRTDYTLKYVKAGKVLWSLLFADFKSSFQCEGIENFWGGSPYNNKFGQGQGLDTRLPMHCQNRPEVAPIGCQNSFGDGTFLVTSCYFDIDTGEYLFATLAYVDILSFNISGRGAPEINSHVEVEVLLEINFVTIDLSGHGTPETSIHVDSNSIPPNSWPSVVYFPLVSMAMTILFYVGGAIVKRRGKLQNVTPKKRKGQRSMATQHNTAVERRHENNSQTGVVGLLEGIGETETTDRSLSLESFDNSGTIDGRKIGGLDLTNKEIAKGSNGTIVLEGYFHGRLVAVKRLVRAHHDVASKEIKNLIQTDRHPNIVKYYGVEHCRDFVYVCLELCTCNLHELISMCASQNQVTSKDQGHEPLSLRSNEELKMWKSNGYPSPLLLELMRDIIRGLAHLHELRIIHRDLKPQNVLLSIDRSISAKISDMGISKRLDGDMSSLTRHATGLGSSGWQAPEQLRHGRQTYAVDLFSLGCILFYCITGGKHPFGENLERDVNIVNDRKDLFLIDQIPEAMDLISLLLHPNPNSRPKAIEVMSHPLFWESEMRLSFLQHVSDRVEPEDRENPSELLKALENGGRVAFHGRWDKKMGNAFINDMRKYRPYRHDSVQDL